MSANSHRASTTRFEAREKNLSLPEFLGRHRWAMLYLAVSLTAFVLLTLAVRQAPYLQLDVGITRWLQSFRSPTLDGIMQFVGLPGFFPQTLIVNALIILIFYLFRLRRAALVLLVGGLLVGLTTSALRYGLDRPRPTPELVTVMQQIERGHYSFPSGHVTGFTAILGFLLFLGLIRLKPSWHSRLLLAIYAFYIVLIGISRIYVGEHWFTDVLGGYLFGSFWLVLMILFYRRIAPAPQSEAPPSA